MATLTSALPFAALLRRARLTAGLTQEALAERAGLSARAVSDLERGNGRKPRLETVTLLADALRLDRDGRAALLAAARPDAAPEPAAPPSVPRTNLPLPLTSFVGRERELVEVGRLLTEHRLVTLTGPGGVGKTRLALAAAAGLAPAFPDGVRFIPLAQVDDAARVVPTIARALGLDEATGLLSLESLARFLRERELLLVVDNLEQVIEAAPDLGVLLAACPRLAILATSREPLRLSGERELLVPPLALPDDPTAPPERLAGFAAVGLFVERARAVDAAFALTQENAEAVAELCRRVDGLPLAIELAAARTRLLPPEALLARFGRRLPLLVGGPRDLPARQRTLRDTIAWSHDLLSDAERSLFRRLACFVDGFSLEGAAAVAVDDADTRTGDDLAALDALEALAAKGLVRREELPGGEARFRMLETIREFGVEQLESAGEGHTVRDAHAGYFLALARGWCAAEEGPDQAAWLDRLEREHANLRAALAWLEEQCEIEPALALAGSLAWFWRLRGYSNEGLARLLRLLARPEARSPTPGRGLAAQGAALLTIHQPDPRPMLPLAEEGLAIARALGDAVGVRRGLWTLIQARYATGGFAAMRRAAGELLARGDREGDLNARAHALAGLAFADVHARMGGRVAPAARVGRAQAHMEAAIALLRRSGHQCDVAAGLGLLGEWRLELGDLAGAKAALEESLAIRRSLDDIHGMGDALLPLGKVARQRGDRVAAGSYLGEALRTYWSAGYLDRPVDALAELARLAAADGATARALTLGGGAAALRETLGLPPLRATDVVGGFGGSSEHAAAWAAGRALPPEVAVALALAK